MSALVDEINARLTQLFQDLARGDVAAPGARLRLEGLLEAAVITDVAAPEQLAALMADLHRQAFGETIEERLGEDWQSWHPFPEIPAFAVRAPVYPSTGD